ncbi:MAG: MarR family transcriptional regulator [Sphingomonas sp.]
MAASTPSASPLFLREPEIRRGVELLYFGYSHMTRSIDECLARQGLGRAHHRALYFIARQPDLTVSQLLEHLAITKQSLGRVLNELDDRGLVESRPGERDRRQRLLRLTAAGATLENDLFEALREKVAAAYARAGQAAVGGFWAVLEGFIPDSERARVEALRR